MQNIKGPWRFLELWKTTGQKNRHVTTCTNMDSLLVSSKT